MFNKEEIIKQIYKVAKINDLFDKINNESEKIEKEHQDLEKKINKLNKEILDLGKKCILSENIDLMANIIEEKKKEIDILSEKLCNLEIKEYEYNSHNLDEKKDKIIKGIEKKIKGLYHVYDEEYRNKFFAEYLSKKFNKKMEYFYYSTSDIVYGFYDDKYIGFGIISTAKICNVLRNFNYKYSVKEIKKLAEKMRKDKNNILNNEFVFTNFLDFSIIFNMNTKELNQNKELLNVLLDYYQFIQNEKTSNTSKEL